YYKSKREEFTNDYSVIAYDNYNSSWKKKHIAHEFDSAFRHYYKDERFDKVVRYEGNLAGNVKEFLRDRYGSNTVYISKVRSRKLTGYENYRSLLLLEKE